MFSRLIGAHLEDDWNGLCETTPAQIHDKHFVKPTYCQDKVACLCRCSSVSFLITCLIGRARDIWHFRHAWWGMWMLLRWWMIFLGGLCSYTIRLIIYELRFDEVLTSLFRNKWTRFYLEDYLINLPPDTHVRIFNTLSKWVSTCIPQKETAQLDNTGAV